MLTLFSPPADLGTCDRALNPNNTEQYIVWGVGGIGATAFRHFIRAQASDPSLHLGRTPMDECGDTTLTCVSCPAYEGQRIVARSNTTFRAVIGPSGNERGYPSITGMYTCTLTYTRCHIHTCIAHHYTHTYEHMHPP